MTQYIADRANYFGVHHTLMFYHSTTLLVQHKAKAMQTLSSVMMQSVNHAVWAG